MFWKAEGHHTGPPHRGERYADCCVVQANRWSGGSLMMWGGISFNTRTPLVQIEGNLTAQQYIDKVLEATIFPFLQANPEVSIFQQDNARPHSARITIARLQENNVQVLPWDQIASAIHRRQPRPANLHQLAAAAQEEWRNIPQQSIQRLIRSMRQRCQDCVNAQGGHTRY